MWSFLARSYAGNTLRAWALALLAAAVTWAVLTGLKRVASMRASVLAEQPEHWFDGFLAVTVENTRWHFPVAVALAVGGFFVALPPHAERALKVLTVTSVLLQLAFWAHHGVRHGISRYVNQHQDDPGVRASASLIGLVSRVIVWVTLFLLVLDNLGVNISALLTGLGIGGIAVALAVQNVLGDLLASLTIALDRPFVPGDLISVDDYQGVVELVGLKTTQLRSLTGERLVFSNTDLVKSRIRNYRVMQERRITSSMLCAGATPVATLEAIPALVREAVETVGDVRFERATLRSLGDPSLAFDIVFHVKRHDLSEVAELQHRVNLAILKAIQTAGISLTAPAATPAPAAVKSL